MSGTEAVTWDVNGMLSGREKSMLEADGADAVLSSDDDIPEVILWMDDENPALSMTVGQQIQLAPRWRSAEGLTPTPMPEPAEEPTPTPEPGEERMTPEQAEVLIEISRLTAEHTEELSQRVEHIETHMIVVIALVGVMIGAVIGIAVAKKFMQMWS